MSNARKPANKPYSLQGYRSEVNDETPFVLWVDDDDKIEIQRPTGDTMLALEGATTSRQVIELIAGDHAERLMKVLGGEDFKVMMRVAEDMQKHFGLDFES